MGLFVGPSEAVPPNELKAPVRVGDQIKHTSFWAALAGAVVGAIAAWAVGAVVLAGLALTPLSGGATAVLAIGAVIAAGRGIGWLSSKTTSVVNSFFPADDGPVILPASPDVLIEGLPAARAVKDTVGCLKHATQQIAQGSKSIFINGSPAARIDDKTVCGGTLKQGASLVAFGGPQTTELDIAEEFSGWQRAILVAVEFLVPPSKCMVQGIRKLPQLLARGGKNLGNLMVKGGKHLGNLARAAGTAVKNFGVKTLNALKRAASIARQGASKAWQSFSKGFKSMFAGACKTNKDDTRKNSGGNPTKACTNTKQCAKDPINTANGAVVDERVDFVVGETMPLRFVRTYDSQSQEGGLLGRGWTDSFSSHLRLSHEGEHVRYYTSAGELVSFNIASDTDRVFHRGFPYYTLIREGRNFAVHDLRDDRTHHFEVLGAHGRLERIDDRSGNQITFDYDGTGLVGVRHGSGVKIRLSRARERGEQLLTIERVDTPEPVLMARYRLRRGLLVEASCPFSDSFRYRHDDAGRMIRWEDHKCSWVAWEYDERGRCIKTGCAGGYYQARFEYDDDARVTRLWDSKGRVTEYHFDANQQLLKRVEPTGGVMAWAYNRHGQVVSEVDTAGHETCFEYDAISGLPSKRIDRQGNATEIFYDRHLRVMGVVDPLEQVWRYERDESGVLTAIVAPDGSRQRYEYDANGRMIGHRAPDGAERRLEFDARGRMTRMTDWLGHAYQYTYDDRDRLVAARDPSGNVDRVDRDSRDLPSVVRHVDDSEVKLEYDSERNLVAVTDENGHTQRTEYGALDFRTATVDGEGRRYEFRYDPDSLRLSEVKAPSGQSYKLERDALGRVKREVDYQGRVTRYTRDAAGNVATRTNNLGQTIRYEHDEEGRATLIESEGERTTFEYDALGRMRAATNRYAELRWTYDELSRVVRCEQNGEVIEYAHDARGFCVERVVQPGPWQQVAHHTGYQRDQNGALTALELANERLEIERDCLGRATKFESPAGYTLDQSYHTRGQLAEQRVGAGASGRAVASLATVHRRYVFDAAQNLTEVHDAHWDTTSYRLDRSNRVLAANNPQQGDEGFRYGTTGMLAGIETAFSGNQHNIPINSEGGELSRVGDTDYAFDAAGRLTRKTQHQKGFRPKTWVYRWNAQDQLVEVKTPKGQTWRYSYDPLGRRVLKYNPSTRASVHFLWDGDVLLRELHLDGAGNPTDAAEERQVAKVTYWHHEPETFRPLAKEEAGETYHVISDQLGTPRELMTSTGEVAWSASYSTWGRVLSKRAQKTDCPIRFPGQYEDAETGLYYNRHRYYDPDAGQYCCSDPIGLRGGAQPFAYVPNPTTWMDPLGLAGGCSETVEYFRVQGGTGNSTSRQRVRVDDSGNVTFREGTLNVSKGDTTHAEYFQELRPGSKIFSFRVPKWFDDLINESAIPQQGYRTNPANQGGVAPKIVDPKQPGSSLELPPVWSEWLNEIVIPGSGKVL